MLQCPMTEETAQRVIRALRTVAALIVCVLLLGTCGAFRVRTHSAPRETQTRCTTRGIAQRESAHAVYAELGRLRALSADKQPVSVIITPLLQYPAADHALYEELVQKKEQLRRASLAWCAQHTAQELHMLGPEQLKIALRDALNTQLSLGRVTHVFLEEFIILF